MESILVLLAVSLYLLPTIIAVNNEHLYKVPVILVNVLGGLMAGLGWIIALVWCFIEPHQATGAANGSIADELEKLNKLRKKGILTQQEFDSKKHKLLNK